ncbi:MAG: putative membrane protein [Ulvibacter sp.]|jgi:putative membrane protein
MPSRNLLQYLIVTAKGLAMGAADVVPGVSGGTIAFISGIYEELIETLDKLDIGFLSVWKKEGVFKAWRRYNLGFLLALFSGVAISILSLAKLITWLLSNHPILVWSFFFGLVLASILYVGRQIFKWDLKTISAILIATGLSYAITLARPIGDTNSTWFLFFAGFIAIIAMILPGISGAFILLLLGAYKSIIGTITQLGEGISNLNWTLFSTAFLKIGVFGLGAIFGLKLFSRVLNWLFQHHKDLILATLTGFMIGALNKIWPWKEVLEYRINHAGEEIPFLEKTILPTNYASDPLIWSALLFMIIGFLTIFLLERIATKKNPS